MPKPSKQRLDKSGGNSAEDRTDSEYAIQSMIELEEKRLERMLTPLEVDVIMRRFSSPDEIQRWPPEYLRRLAKQKLFEITKYRLQVEAEKSK